MYLVIGTHPSDQICSTETRFRGSRNSTGGCGYREGTLRSVRSETKPSGFEIQPLFPEAVVKFQFQHPLNPHFTRGCGSGSFHPLPHLHIRALARVWLQSRNGLEYSSLTPRFNLRNNPNYQPQTLTIISRLRRHECRKPPSQKGFQFPETSPHSTTVPRAHARHAPPLEGVGIITHRISFLFHKNDILVG